MRSLDKCGELGILVGQQALGHLDQSRRMAPLNQQVLASWAQLLARLGTLDEAIDRTEREAAADSGARLGLVYLYRAAGREDEARELFREINAAR